ncbi:MAG TPA: HIT family protein [Methanoculleus sp.]|nr:HIT family protein [Methanoculleus sp.]
MPTLFDATDAELLALAREAKTLLDDRYHPDGYNVGVNVRAAAGQTVMHLHVHVIPRYAGDVEDPRGGVRGAIPEKRVY